MTKLLVTARNHDEIDVALASGADIVELVATPDDAPDLLAFANRKKGQGRLCLQLDAESLHYPDLNGLMEQVEMIRLMPFPNEKRQADFIHRVAQQKELMLTFDASLSPDQLLEHMARWAQGGVDAVMLATKGHLLKSCPLPVLDRLTTAAHETGLNVALSGLLEAPDIPRLLTLSPDILAFDADHQMADDNLAKQDNQRIIRALIRRENEMPAPQRQNFGTDRLIVKDFILPVKIGAYHHERGRQQRVRFNVLADVARLSNDPQDMRHIFSYDLIMDAIRRLAARDHIELVETLAEQIATNILTYPSVHHVVVRVEKLDLEPEAVGVEISRRQPL